MDSRIISAVFCEFCGKKSLITVLKSLFALESGQSKPKVARTIADLAGSKDIEIELMAEAIHFRSLDREEWAG